ncbi:helix-turn-helix transcriptional regulator [Shewanella indica]|uniref:helix-turn-helix domain-containing protein n=1 Tax=Shewanella indica TaxID=768528 RepID=UPI00300769EE
MIRCHLARMMGERKMRIADVARATGLSRATITLLYKETAQKVDLEALDKLCELFDCGISELLERTTLTTNKHQMNDANH